MDRLSWDQYFMAQAHLLSLRSTCPRLKVGSTVIRDNRIIAGGYNGSIAGGKHCNDEGCYVVDGHCIRTIHAEVNAILQCAKFGVSTDDSSIYITHYPCVDCAKTIIQSGVREVVYAEDYKNHPYAKELFESAGVKTRKVPLDEGVLDYKNNEKLAFTADLLKRLEKAGASSQELEELHEIANKLFVS